MSKRDDSSRSRWTKSWIKMHDEMVEGKTNKEQTGKSAEQMSKIMSKFMTGRLWENLAPAKWRTDEKRRREFEEQAFKSAAGTPEEGRKAGEQISKLMIERLWEDLAPAKWKNSRTAETAVRGAVPQALESKAE